jgi:hypothetical protein
MNAPLARAGLLLILALGLVVGIGCSDGESSSGETGSGSGDASASKGDPEAVKAVSEELAKHWAKSPNGWTSEYPTKVRLGTGERAGPESFYREVKDLTFNVDSETLSESDKLNGVSFRGECDFNSIPYRIYGDPASFGPPAWSNWQASWETLRIEKRNGKWIMGGNMNSWVNGTKPSPETVAGLK